MGDKNIQLHIQVWYVDLLYYNQYRLLHVSATYCGHLQGGVLGNLHFIYTLH
jgi:hypothetical protein